MRRSVSLLATSALLAALLIPIATTSTPAAATPNSLSVIKSGPGSILIGNSGTFTLTATNDGTQPQYNVSFRDVLPLGVSYTGPTTPGDVGEPLVIGNGTTLTQTLIWPDTFDLQPNATNEISFAVSPSTTSYVVGSSFNNAATVYGSSDPRYIPKFNPDGTPVPNANVIAANSNTVTTAVTALKITKDEPSPESELLRGVHDQSTIYTLVVANNPAHTTDAVTVTDYLPADQEFLGCGTIDNTPGGTAEYPGAPALSAVPDVTSGCAVPASVDTVTDPPGHSGVYTKIVWTLDDLAAGASTTINYRAGIPLRENVAFPGGTSTGGVQAANLANNTGAPTRQSGSGAQSTNFVSADGTYTGSVVGTSHDVTATASKTVTINDVRIHKSVLPTAFTSGDVATYSLTIDTGEYEDASAIAVTDVLPNGVCPLDEVANYAPPTPANGDCAPAAGFQPSDAYQSVTEQAGVGTFTVVFTPLPALAHDQTTTITYQGRMRAVYTDGALHGEPTSSGDSFTNRAVQSAHTEPRTDTPIGVDTGQNTVTDPTSATQTTTPPSLMKQVGDRVTPMSCASATYRGLESPVPPALTFTQGDRICFLITVHFSLDADSLNPVLTDFLPSNTTYEANSFQPGPANTVDPSEFGFDETTAASASELTWTLGHPTAQGQLEVDHGRIFQAMFSALVMGTAPGPAPDKIGNLAKFREVDSAGQALSLRDEVDFAIAPAPVAIKKGVSRVNATDYLPARDGVAVREGDSVLFHVDVTNASDPSVAPPGVAISAVQVWDVLPVAIGCASISAIGNGGVCTDPGDVGHPTFAGSTTHSAVVWTGGVSIAAGATHTYVYTVTVPPGTSVENNLVNTSYVRSYDVTTDLGGGDEGTHYPASNIDPNLPGDAILDPAPASDPSNILLPSVSVTKQVVSAVNEAGNVGQEVAPGAASTQAVPGESLSYTVSARIPAHATVYAGLLTDALPAGLVSDSSNAQFAANAAAPAYTALPAGTAFDGNVTISLGSSYDNTTGTDQLFTLFLTGHLDRADAVHNLNGKANTNTGTFSSQAGPDGGPKPADHSAAATTSVVEPSPTLTKSNNHTPPATVSAGTTVTYTLIAANATGRPPLHDAWVVDCLPGTLTFVAFGAIPGGTTATTQPGSNGASSSATACASGTTEIDWNAHDLAAAASRTLTYTATVNPGAAGNLTYANTANLTGNSLAGTRAAPTDPGAVLGRTYTKAAGSSVKITPASIVKSAAPSTPTIGETITYTVTVTLPANVTFYSLSIIDTLPAAITPLVTPPTATATCTNADTTPCAITTATALATAGTKVGWLFGDVAESTSRRTVVLTYQAKVADVPAAIAGATPTNSASIKWNTAPSTPPTSAGATFDQTAGPATAAVTVREPNLSIAKSVSNATPQPGSNFTYTVGLSNSAAVNISAAFNVTVTDTVPVGVVVDPLTISNGGTISGADVTTGGGTISWTVAGPLAKGATQNLTYSATLAPSGTLSGAGLTNTARVTGYDSLSGGGRHYAPNSTATAKVTPLFPAITATKSATDGPVTYLGAQYRWTLTVTDASAAGTALHVGATDVLPPNWTFDSSTATVSVNGGSAAPVTPTASTAGATQTLTFTDLATLAAGQNLTITYTATPGPGVVTNPGIGHSAAQTNSVTPTGVDATGATGSGAGSYSGGPATAVTHIDAADVAVTKAVGVAPIAGRDGTWTVTVRNNGPDSAVGPFAVTDPFDTPLPTGVSFVSVAGTGWTCVQGPITCSRSDASDALADGAAFPAITITYHIASDVAQGTDFENSATVAARTYDPAPGNNTDDASTTVSTLADIGIAKQLADSSIVPGTVATYTVSVTNYGPSVSRGPITVTDTLPTGSTFVSASGTDWTCPNAATGGTIACTHAGDLDAGTAAHDIVVSVRFPSNQTATVVNAATVTPTTTEPTPDTTHPDTDTVSTDPSPSADVEISKVLADPPVVAGGSSSYTITVTNHGPSDAANVVVTDTLPALLTFDSVSDAADWTCSNTGQTVRCAYSPATSLASGATSTFTLKVTVGQQFRGTLRNTAVVTSDTPDADPDTNSSTSDSGVTDLADLSIAKSHTGTAVAGHNLTFALQVRNHGSSDEAGDISVTDLMPAHLTFVSAGGTGWSCVYDDSNRTVTCTGATDLAAGADAAPITVVAGVDPDAGPATITNVAGVTGNPDSPDPDPSNNSAADPVTVSVQTDVTLTKTLDSTTPVAAGTTAQFTLTVTNAGPSDAAHVLVTDSLPAHLTFRSAAGAGWDCDHTGSLISCARDSVPASPPGTAVAAITVVADVDPATPDGTTVDNVATASIGSPGTPHQPDPVPVAIARSADLAVQKSADPASVTAGTDVIWHVTVTNHGPSDAEGTITVTDTLPGFETFVSSAGAGWTCTAGAPADPPGADQHQVVTCTRADPLAAGSDDDRLQITAHVDPAAPVGDETNTASVASPTDDPAAANNTATAPVTVNRTGQLTIVKSHAGNGTVGGQLPFMLAVRNAGPSQADQVVVTDEVPVGLDYVSAVGSAWTCAVVSRTVTCSLAGVLAPQSDAAPITLTTSVLAPAYPGVTNTATVHSDDPDLPGSDSSDDPVVVDPDAQLAITKRHQGHFAVGGDGRYSIVVRNTGPTATPGPVTVSDHLPLGLEFASASGSGWACTNRGPAVTCTHAAGLAVDATGEIALVVHIDAAAYPDVQNAATATAPGSSPVTGADTAMVAPLSQLRVAKRLAGYTEGVATYAITLSNDGPNPTAEPAGIVDPLPEGLSYLSAAGTGWACSAAGQTVTCLHAANVAVGHSATVTLRASVTAEPGAKIVNVAFGGLSSEGVTGPHSNPVPLVVPAVPIATTGIAVWAELRIALLLLLSGAAALMLGRRRAGRPSAAGRCARHRR